MKTKWFNLSALILTALTCSLPTEGQATISPTGLSTSLTTGSVAYTVGQVAFNMFPGGNGYIIEGVHQPYEISVVTAIVNTDNEAIEYSLYPNPADDLINLVVTSFNDGDITYQLYKLDGSVLQEDILTRQVTEIYMKDYASGSYLLRVVRGGKEAKVFKIIKK